jgi:tetratricopeptide (TPR) repeat protein
VSQLAAQGKPSPSILGLVNEVEGDRVRHVEVRIDGGGANVTTDSGEFAIPFSGNLKVGFPAVFHVAGWIILHPCELKNGRTYLRAPQAEPIELLVLRRGDPRLKSAEKNFSILGCLIEEEAASFPEKVDRNAEIRNAPSNPEPLALAVSGKHKSFQDDTTSARVIDVVYYPATAQTSPHASTEQEGDPTILAQEQFLATKAEALGFSVEELKSALAVWSRSVQDPYHKGLAALHNKQYRDAVRYISESIESSDKDAIERYVPLSRAQFELGNYDAAEDALRKVLAVHMNDPKLLNDLGIVLAAQAKYDKAAEQFGRALNIVESNPEGDPALMRGLLNNMGLMKYKRGDYDQAEAYYDKAITLNKQAQLPADPDNAALLSNLAEIYFEEGKYDKAQSLNENALHIDEAAFGPNGLAVGTDLNALAMLFQQQGKVEAAERFYKRAIDIESKAIGAQARLDSAKTQTNLADLYTSLHRYKEAETLYKSALAKKREILKPDDPSIGVSLSDLAKLYMLEGKYADAVRLAGQALNIDEGKPDGNPRYVATDLEILGTVHFYQHEYGLAKRDLERAKGILERLPDPDKNPEFRDILFNLANVYNSLLEYGKTESLLKRALKGEEDTPKPNFEMVAQIAEFLAQTSRKLGNEKAAGYYEQKARVAHSKASASAGKNR